MRKAAIVLALVCLCGCAEASISRQVVSRAWQRVTAADGFDRVPIHYERDSDPNAWVRWQGEDSFTMHVTAGLMSVLETEAEIAGVLGHEIGHVRCGHYDGMVLSDTASTIMNTNLERTDPLTQAVGKIGNDLREAAFSREQETEADEYGVSLLKRAGYDQKGLYDALAKLGGGDASAFSSHPATRERLQHLAGIIGKGGTPAKTGQVRNTPDEVDDIAAAIMGR